MFRSLTISATEFKARCLDLLDRLGTSKLDQVVITLHGRTVAILTPSRAQVDAVQSLHGFMRGSVVVPDELDLTAPVLDDNFDAGTGLLHDERL